MNQTTPPAPGNTRRWPYFGGPQKVMVFAGFGIWMGTALPWFIFRPLGIANYASPLAASWVLWAGLMCLAGAIARWRFLALFSAVAGGGTALGIAFWQMLLILDRCGYRLQLQCFPGPGIFVVEVAGAVVLYQSYRLFVGLRTG